MDLPIWSVKQFGIKKPYKLNVQTEYLDYYSYTFSLFFRYPIIDRDSRLCVWNLALFLLRPLISGWREMENSLAVSLFLRVDESQTGICACTTLIVHILQHCIDTQYCFVRGSLFFGNSIINNNVEKKRLTPITIKEKNYSFFSKK